MAARRSLPVQLGAVALIGACQPAEPETDGQLPEATASPAATALTCSGPITAGDTAVSLQQRFAGAGRWETLHGPEASEFAGLVLWPDDPARRLEVIFTDEEPGTVSSVAVGPGSQWRVAGLGLGDPLARVNEANGKPFKLWGFSWDYGGYVSDLGGGKLAALPGRCRVIIRFAPREGAEVADDLVGDREVSSGDPRLEAAGVAIEELTLAF